MNEHSRTWLQIMYEVAWRQYSHEDDIGHSRSTLFATIQTALIATLAALAGWLVKGAQVSTEGDAPNVRLLALGIIAVVFWVFGSRLAALWKGVTATGQRYLNMRWVTAKALEETAGLEYPTGAGIEHEWRAHSVRHPDKRFYALPQWEAENRHGIRSYEEPGGWSSIDCTISVIQGLWYVILVLGVALIVASVVPWARQL